MGQRRDRRKLDEDAGLRIPVLLAGLSWIAAAVLLGVVGYRQYTSESGASTVVFLGAGFWNASTAALTAYIGLRLAVRPTRAWIAWSMPWAVLLLLSLSAQVLTYGRDAATELGATASLLAGLLAFVAWLSVRRAERDRV